MWVSVWRKTRGKDLRSSVLVFWRYREVENSRFNLNENFQPLAQTWYVKMPRTGSDTQTPYQPKNLTCPFGREGIPKDDTLSRVLGTRLLDIFYPAISWDPCIPCGSCMM